MATRLFGGEVARNRQLFTAFIISHCRAQTAVLRQLLDLPGLVELSQHRWRAAIPAVNNAGSDVGSAGFHGIGRRRSDGVKQRGDQAGAAIHTLGRRWRWPKLSG